MRLLVSALFGACLIVTGCGRSTVPLSDATKATLDKKLIGVWRESNENGVGYFHVGRLGGDTPKGVMRVVIVGHPKGGGLEGPDSLVAFRSDLGGKDYLNVAEVTQEQLASIRKDGWQPDMLGAYILLEYRFEGDALVLRGMDNQAMKKAIRDGKIKGEIEEDDFGARIRFTDTTENLAKFVVATGDGLFSDEPLRFERVR